MFGNKNKAPTPSGVGSSEEGLKRALGAVRLVQNYAAVGAEILILVAFAMSSLDVSVGGNLAEIDGLAWMWGAVFALGIDTCFVLSWVRVRQLAVVHGKRRHLVWAIPLALGMSFIVFQPVAIQQLQQSLHVSFEQALANLGVNLGFLVYARSGVAVFLGAVLALTNVESSVADRVTEVTVATGGNVTKVVEEKAGGLQPDEHAGGLLTEKAESRSATDGLTEDMADLLTEPDGLVADQAAGGGGLAVASDGNNQTLTGRAAAWAVLTVDPDVNLTKLAEDTGIPRSTLRDWRNKMRESK